MQMLPSGLRQSFGTTPGAPGGPEQLLLQELLERGGFNVSPLLFSSPGKRSWSYPSRSAWFGAITFGSNPGCCLRMCLAYSALHEAMSLTDMIL